ncbi:metal ABC transporter permease [Scytonema sp. NUACC26]|uniref:metal ABC transporter permease n=1 Tax=Scytonema sp. NUACC26 TaxID=3140176 RepID=UPI0034DC7C56
MNLILEPLSFEFMRNAIIVGILMGILCAVVGSYMIVQQMGMMAHAISHSVVAGLPIAYVLGISLSVGAAIAGVVSAIMLAAIEAYSRVKLDSAMALILSEFLAVGVTLISILPGANRIDLVNILFGNILGVNRDDLILTLILTGFILVLTTLFYKELLFYTFDPLGAQAQGMPTKIYYIGLVTAITLTVVASLQTVGSLLVIAMLVGPAVTAYLLVKELHAMMIWGSVFGAVSSVVGMYMSYYLDIPSGAAIVLIVFGFFFLAFLFSFSYRRLK